MQGKSIQLTGITSANTSRTEQLLDFTERPCHREDRRRKRLTGTNQDTGKERTETDDKTTESLCRLAVTEKRHQHLAKKGEGVESQEDKCEEEKELVSLRREPQNEVEHYGKNNRSEEDKWKFLLSRATRNIRRERAKTFQVDCR